MNNILSNKPRVWYKNEIVIVLNQGRKAWTILLKNGTKLKVSEIELRGTTAEDLKKPNYW